MRQNGIPPVFTKSWPIETNLNYPDLNKSLLWSPWGVFNSDNIHCYTDDYRFEIAWRKPELSLKRVLDLNFILSPDFTVYPEAPEMINRWQLFRSLSVFAYWQNMGTRVIPSINWISQSQIQKDRDLYPPFSIIAVRCPGMNYLEEWISGVETIKEIINPEIVLHFGTSLGSEIWKDCKVYKFSLRPKIR
jgi:hypothetical protein